MWHNRVVIVFLVNLFTFVGLSRAYKYNIILEDDEVFSKCENKQGNVLDLNGLLDLSELIIKPDFNKVSFSGNVSLMWDIQLSDRVQIMPRCIIMLHYLKGCTLQFEGQLFKFDRGSWLPTMYAIKIWDFCSIMYDKNQYWYSSWLAHVTNLGEVKDKCLNVPGVRF